MDKKKLLLGLIGTHRQRNERSYNRILLIMMPLTLTSLVGFIYCLLSFLNKFGSYLYDNDSYKVGALMLGITTLILLIISCIYFFAGILKDRRLMIFSKMDTKILVWKLENDQWISYLDYIYGPNRPYERYTCLTWSCREKRYNRLKERNYGYIIFTMNGIIIDEFEVFIFKKKISLALFKLISYSNEQFILRIYTLELSLLKDANIISNQDIEEKGLEIDLFVPNIFNQPIERLKQMVDLFNLPNIFQRYLNENFNQICDLFQQ